MLTSPDLLELARTRGIFALPTRMGERGCVLLASLGLDLGVPVMRGTLLTLARDKEIVLVHVDQWAAANRSLVERGCDPWLLQQSLVRSGRATYHTVLAEAVPTTAEGLTTAEIESVRDAHPTSNPFFAWCTEALAGNPYSRARIAAAINRRRGVLL